MVTIKVLGIEEMGNRGKKSSDEIIALKLASISAVKRPESPADLTKAQADAWHNVVSAMPADWFPRETHALLEQYCRHVVSARRIAEIVESLNADDFNLDNFDRLLRMQERESRATSSLATRMRITHQARFSHRKTTGPKTPKPWE